MRTKYLIAFSFLILSSLAVAAPCDQAVFNSSYTCPDGEGGTYPMILSLGNVRGFDAITVSDNEYDQEFISYTGAYNTTPLGQTIGLCNGKKFTIDIYQGTGLTTVHSQIQISNQDLTSGAVRVTKFVRHPQQSAFTRSFVCKRSN